ncbi:MAG: hypothetical protein PHQ53_02920 [Candidatus Krumholzibacteria bacterium]|nr:hypothetical protein [Candidatus Krumholzibacteria bacterium]
MSQHVVVGIHVTDRLAKAGDVQKVLTDFGCNIKTRIGLHEANAQGCSPAGIILLEIYGGEKVLAELKQRLAAIAGIEVQAMVFNHAR